jgi:hypothetical protein
MAGCHVVGGQRNVPASLPREVSGIHWIGSGVGLRAFLEVTRKISLPPEFDPRSLQPLSSRYTDWAIPAHWIQQVLSFSRNKIVLCRSVLKLT